jgi:DNA-binding protein YbaB
MTNSSRTIQSNTGSSNQATPLDNKSFAKLGDGASGGEKVTKNVKTLGNQVAKDGLNVAKAGATVAEFSGVGTLAGIAVNAAISGADEYRQVKIEGKSADDAGKDFLTGTAISTVFSGLGEAAKSTVKGAGKALHDAAVDGYTFVLGNLTQWGGDKVKEKQKTDEQKKKN